MLRSLQPHKLVCSGELNGVAWQVLISGGSKVIAYLTRLPLDYDTTGPLHDRKGGRGASWMRKTWLRECICESISNKLNVQPWRTDSEGTSTPS